MFCLINAVQNVGYPAFMNTHHYCLLGPIRHSAVAWAFGNQWIPDHPSCVVLIIGSSGPHSACWRGGQVRESWVLLRTTVSGSESDSGFLGPFGSQASGSNCTAESFAIS